MNKPRPRALVHQGSDGLGSASGPVISGWDCLACSLLSQPVERTEQRNNCESFDLLAPRLFAQ